MRETVTPEEVAAAMKVSVPTVRRLCARGELPCTRFAGKWRIYKVEFAEYLRSREPEPGVVQPERKVARKEGELRLVAGGVST